LNSFVKKQQQQDDKKEKREQGEEKQNKKVEYELKINKIISILLKKKQNVYRKEKVLLERWKENVQSLTAKNLLTSFV
jgi:hypothetical protein